VHGVTDPRAPVLVGVAQVVDRGSAPGAGLAPADLLARVGVAALADCGGRDIAVDVLAVVRLFADTSPLFRSPFGTYANLPRSMARRMGQAPARLIYGPVGGHSPQLLVNLLAEEIRRGAIDVAMVAGGEALRSQAAAQRAGLALDWSEDGDDSPETLGAETMLASPHEMAHGIALPVNVYPLFENALGAHYGRSPLEHRRRLGELMAPFTRVAAANPYAALPVARGADELVTPTEANRLLAYPYTKYLAANLFVDQAAAVLLMSNVAADRAGVPESKRVHLHGGADTHDRILVSQRVDYHSSPAIRVGAAHALAQAGLDAAALDHLDLYSCFPAAVEIAADMIGIAHDDPRGLTLTGGLPYFGGPGNNYSTHAIAEAVARCRARPGSTGLVYANGGYLTKHSFGVYSTTAVRGWARADPASCQGEIDALASPDFTEAPAGAGSVETFTVACAQGRPAYAIVIGRLDDGRRFLAQMRERLDELIDAPVIGRRIVVDNGDPVNLARLA
jgi:acetyl-CoA C-acetyltransferase